MSDSTRRRSILSGEPQRTAGLMEGYGGIQKTQWVFGLHSAEMRTDQGLACRCERPTETRLPGWARKIRTAESVLHLCI
jgi:hypothetical protein